LLTVEGSTPSCSANHLLVLFFSTRTSFILFTSSMLSAFNATKIVNIYHFKAIFSVTALIIMFFYEFSGAIEPIASIRQRCRRGKRYWEKGSKVLPNREKGTI